MANEELEKFMMRLSHDEKLRKEFKERCVSQLGLKGKKPYEVIKSVMVETGEAHGYSFSLEDLKAYERIFRPSKLDDKELEKVTGGRADEYVQSVLSSLCAAIYL